MRVRCGNAGIIECWICGADTVMQWGVPAYEDQILPNDWEGEWFGQSVCEPCHGDHATGRFDVLYQRQQERRRHKITYPRCRPVVA